MPDNETVVVTDPAPPGGGIKIRSKSRIMLVMNLDTYDGAGKRESLYLAPRVTAEITEAQYQSSELQKLITIGSIVRR